MYRALEITMNVQSEPKYIINRLSKKFDFPNIWGRWDTSEKYFCELSGTGVIDKKIVRDNLYLDSAFSSRANAAKREQYTYSFPAYYGKTGNPGMYHKVLGITISVEAVSYYRACSTVILKCYSSRFEPHTKEMVSIMLGTFRRSEVWSASRPVDGIITTLDSWR